MLPIREWWSEARHGIEAPKKGTLNTLVPLVIWSIWRERNSRVFDHKSLPLQRLIDQVKEEAKIWEVASSGRFTV